MTRLLVEDRPFLDGSARFTADLPAAGALVVRFVRSPIAHGELHGVDAAAALALPGVHAVLTDADLQTARYAMFAQLGPAAARSLLAVGRVRFAGEPVALVVADDEAAAEDAAELVQLDLVPLPALVDPGAALDGPPLHDGTGSNAVLVTRQEAPVDPLAGAAVVVRRRVPSPRLSPLPLETSAIVVHPVPPADVPGGMPERRIDDDSTPADVPYGTVGLGGVGSGLDVWCACQGVHAVRDDLAAALGLPVEAVRVRAPAVGGGFGARYRPPHEYLAVAAAALRLGRTLRWSEERTEQLLAQPHGRGHDLDVALGVTADGAFTGLVVRGVADAGAYPHQAPLLVEYTRKMAPGPYRMPQVDVEITSVLTTTAPVGAYRGAGQPEIALALETLVDEAARRLGLDPVELRRRNLLAADELPCRTVTGVQYDTGDPAAALDELLARLDVERWRVEAERRRRTGEPTRIGVGIACYAQITAVGMLSMRGQVAIDHTGAVTAGAGGHGHGQGHRSTFARLVGEALGLDPAAVTWADADTTTVATGHGTGGSRTAALVGAALTEATAQLLDGARALAAERLEADPADIVVVDGGLAVAGVPVSRLAWDELARLAGPDGLRAVVDAAPMPANTPYGAHGSVVEVDVETGKVTVLRHVAVDDCGTRLEPVLVEGQQHGGAVAGIAQALGERIAYDADGTPRTTTLVDYVVPAACDVPAIEAGGPALAATTNVVGVRGIGENGAIAATPAVRNAVADALGVDHIDLPLTPERIWRSLKGDVT